MAVNLSYNSPYPPIVDAENLSKLLMSQWGPEMAGDDGQMQMLKSLPHGETMSEYGVVGASYMLDCLNVTAALRADAGDSSIPAAVRMADVSEEKRAEESSDADTKADAINRENQEYLDYLRTKTNEITNAILRTDFEDGMDNDVTHLFKKFSRQNKAATFNWIAELYSINLNKPVVVEGLLRIVSMITEKGDETILLPLVVASLRSEISAEQEAAVMVIEEWRTRECLEAIRSVTRFSSDIVKDYANMVADELEEELG